MIGVGTPHAPAITVRDVSVSFGGVNALDHVSFEVARGRVTALVGPNGAGKSTLIRVILGLQRPDHGDAKVLGRPLRAHDCPLRSLGAVTDIASADPRMSPRDFLRYVCAWSGIPPDRVEEVLAVTSARRYRHRRIGTLSTGMRQRVMLAAALLGDPQVLLLDEPHNGLDPDGIRWLRGFLRELAGQGRSILIASHLLDEIKKSADDLVMLDRKVKFAGTMDRFLVREDLEDTFAALVGGGSL